MNKRLLAFFKNYTGYIITIVTFISYVATLSRNYMGDGIQFAMAIESNHLENLLLPNHMLYPVLGLLFYRAWQYLGWQEGALYPLQVLSAIGGGLAVGIMFSIARRITKSTWVALLVAIGFGVSHGVWLYSTDAEAVTIPLALNLVLVCLLVSNLDMSKWYNPIIYGLLCSLSIITYQTGVFLIAVVIVSYLMENKVSWRIRIRQIVVFLLVVGLVTGFVYLLVAFFVFGITNWQGLLDWQFHMSRFGLWGQPSLRNLVQGGYAFLRTFAGYPGLGPGTRTTVFFENSTLDNRLKFGIYYAVVLLIAIVPLLITVKMRRNILRSHRRNLAIITTLGVLYGGFAIYWVPGDIQFWVIVLISWWLMVGILLSERGNSDTEFSQTLKNPSLSYGMGMALVVVTLLISNLVTTILPNHDSQLNKYYQIAMSVNEHTSPDDLIITTGGDGLFLYIPYFAKRQTVSVYHQLLYTERNKADVFTYIDQEIHRTLSNGDHVFLACVSPGKDVWWDSLQYAGLTKEDFNHYKTKLAWKITGEEILEVLP